MAKPDAKPKPVPKVPAAYAKYLVEIAASKGLDRAEFARLAGYDGDQMIYRLESGRSDGSVKAAYRMRQVLVDMGMTIPPVPVGGEDWTPPGPSAPPRVAVLLDPEEETIRRNLVRFREDLRLSVHDASEATGISLDTIRSYELGTETVSGTHLKRLAEFYGHDMNHATLDAPPETSLVSRKQFEMRAVDPRAVELLTPVQRDQFERLKKEAAELNEAARKKLEAQAKKPK